MSKSDMERFWDKVDQSGDCWEWLAYKDKDGYGNFKVGGKSVQAHRYIFEVGGPPIPSGMCVCHTCDNPSCVNPDHLWLGTQEENLKDMAKKGRARGGRNLGSKNGNAKLTEEQVKAIRGLYGTNAKISRQIGMSYAQITRIRDRTSWTHI